MYPNPEDVIFREQDLFEEPLIDPNVAPLEILDAKDEAGHTALHRAALQNRHEEVRRLIALGANVTLTDRWGENPFFNYALTVAGATSLWTIKEKSSHEPFIEKICFHVMVPRLFYYRQFDELMTLLKKDHMQSQSQRFMQTKTKNHEYTPLMLVAMEGYEYFSLMKWMINITTPETLKHKDTDGHDIVFYLKENNHLRSLQYLVKQYPDLYIESNTEKAQPVGRTHEMSLRASKRPVEYVEDADDVSEQSVKRFKSQRK